jgi:hypothetical protein
MNDDPKKKPTKEELAKANSFARQFALRKNLITGENTNVGNAIPPFIDAQTGVDLTGKPNTSQLPPNTITDIRMLPNYVTSNDLITGKDGLSYFQNQDGDMIPIHPDIVRSSRLNPNRGQTDLTRALPKLDENYLAQKLQP